MEILAKDRYSEFVSFAENHKNTSFTQSLEWAALKSGWEHEIVISRKNGEIKGAMLILIERLPVYKFRIRRRNT